MIVLTTGLSALLTLMGEAHSRTGPTAGQPATPQSVRPAQSVRRPTPRQ